MADYTAHHRRVAERYGIELAVVQAFVAVESGGRAFEREGSPRRRFEPHHITGQLRDDVELFVTERKANGFRDAAVSRGATVDGDPAPTETMTPPARLRLRAEPVADCARLTTA